MFREQNSWKHIGSYHVRLDETTKYTKLKGFDRDELMRGHKMTYSEGTGKLIVCGGQKQDEYGDHWMDSDSIWICDVDRRCQIGGYLWRELHCKLPFGGKTFGAVVGFGAILVVIYLRDSEKKEIHCLDLTEKESEYKLVKSDRKFPFDGDCEYTDVIKTDNEMVHCMYFGLYGHCRLSLSKIIPNAIKKRHKRRNRFAVSGFIRNQIELALCRKTPRTIINAISKYMSDL